MRLLNTVADQQMPPQPPQPDPSQSGPSFPPPTPGFQWVQAPAPQPHPDYQGYFATHISAGRPLPKIPPIPYQSRYKSFNNTKQLTNRLGVCPTSETLKTLEGPYLQQEETRDPRPTKRSRTDSPRGEVQGRAGKVRDEEVVSLGESDPEFDRDPLFGDEVMDHQDEMFNNMDFGREGEIDESAGLSMSLQVLSTQSIETNTNNNLQLDNYIAVVSPNKFCCSCSHECECKPKETTEWIIDSGASSHFTNSMSDFIDFEKFKERRVVYTANSSAEMIGQGTVLIVLSTGVVARIYPVIYIPSLSCKLLSLGTFLKNGLLCTGLRSSIQVLKGSKPFMTFRPRNKNETLYVVKAHVADKAESYTALDTIYSIDYETLHKRLAHPSKEVLQKARKHIKDFPEIEFPTEEKLCPGCAQGKMTNRSFPPSTKRASQPFELIHSDLKSFPIDSYHKYKYVIVFLDNYISNAWTVNLHTKDAALSATYQFIQLVKNRFDSRIIQWMSDAGGEYKSKVFEKMLKDRGIEILQSIPYVHQQNGRAE
jgi:hypothetical protein